MRDGSDGRWGGEKNSARSCEPWLEGRDHETRRHAGEESEGGGRFGLRTWVETDMQG
jgi:hypothetical protein